MQIERQLMRGAGPLAVLKLLEKRQMYGYELVEALSARTGGLLAMGQSTLYPMLYNLQAKGLIAARVDAAGPRPRKYYRLTSRGKRRLAADVDRWQSVVEALGRLGVGPRSNPKPAGGRA